jgi:hypothetical protein
LALMIAETNDRRRMRKASPNSALIATMAEPSRAAWG